MNAQYQLHVIQMQIAQTQLDLSYATVKQVSLGMVLPVLVSTVFIL